MAQSNRKWNQRMVLESLPASAGERHQRNLLANSTGGRLARRQWKLLTSLQCQFIVHLKRRVCRFACAFICLLLPMQLFVFGFRFISMAFNFEDRLVRQANRQVLAARWTARFAAHRPFVGRPCVIRRIVTHRCMCNTSG